MVNIVKTGFGLASGALLKPLASGGLLGFAGGGIASTPTSMSGSEAIVVPPNTWRVITHLASAAGLDKHATGTQYAHAEHAADTDDRASAASTPGTAMRDPQNTGELHSLVGMVDCDPGLGGSQS